MLIFVLSLGSQYFSCCSSYSCFFLTDITQLAWPLDMGLNWRCSLWMSFIVVSLDFTAFPFLFFSCDFLLFTHTSCHPQSVISLLYLISFVYECHVLLLSLCSCPPSHIFSLLSSYSYASTSIMAFIPFFSFSFLLCTSCILLLFSLCDSCSWKKLRSILLCLHVLSSGFERVV